MNLELSKYIFDKINSSKLTSHKNNLFESAIRYARIRTDWYFLSDDEKLANDDMRSRTHNALIDTCNILSREMLKIGEDASWRNELGNDRREIGDFACYAHLLFGMMSR